METVSIPFEKSIIPSIKKKPLQVKGDDRIEDDKGQEQTFFEKRTKDKICVDSSMTGASRSPRFHKRKRKWRVNSGRVGLAPRKSVCHT